MMEQDTNKDYLRKLLNFLQSRILSIPANQWFTEDLRKILAPASDTRISEIHEQCIEKILQEQATEFYKDFVIAEIRSQLISDFIKMEHWRRRNNVQEFCMALYQQIEAITNYLGADNDLNQIWRNIRNAKFFVDITNKPIDIRKRWDNSKIIEDYIIYKKENYSKTPELKDLLAMDKYKAILFLIVCNTNVCRNTEDDFKRKFFLGKNIYDARNLNHRGNITELSEGLKNIIEAPTYSMCYMLGFYAWFVAGINKHYPISKELVEFGQNSLDLQ